MNKFNKIILILWAIIVVERRRQPLDRSEPYRDLPRRFVSLLRRNAKPRILALSLGIAWGDYRFGRARDDCIFGAGSGDCG